MSFTLSSESPPKRPSSDREFVGSYSGSVLIISSIDNKNWFFTENGLDSVDILL
ncbi:hypothetical protein DPMN_143307 [Dreissena polymorpha]|uniref:Uncharacterized protein n=1 Tax=Dreissena polymorpha TaxID=45954 RepID=A0A9D4GCU7_DREPO|nr:hypothetical protein DPMN_143307 [Dreissena polymorpha]